MHSEPKELIEARQALSESEEVLTNPRMLPRFRKGISLLADFIVGDDVRLRDVAKNLISAYRLKVLWKINNDFSEIDSQSDESLEHWGNVLEAFFEAGLDQQGELVNLRIEILERLSARLHANSTPVKLAELQQSLRDYLAKKT
jgi:hypothetical protein